MKERKIEIRNINDLILYENNPRNNDNAVDKVAESIKEFGFNVPVVIDKNDVIITGHTRIKACRKLGIENIPTIKLDDLSPQQVKAYRLVDNKVGELAEWDFELLESELSELGDFDMAEFGFETNLIEDEPIEEDEKPEIKFSEELGEESNYIVLKFDTDVDWLRLETLFKLKRVKALDSRKGFERIGLGRVVNGNEFIEEIMEKGKGDFLG